MCGLFGAASNAVLTESEIYDLECLALISQLRGKHSTGISFVNKKGNNKNTINLLKKTVPSGVYLESEEWSNFKKEYQFPYMALGHTRHATVGELSLRNAQPFIVADNIVGCHNGTFSNIKDPEDTGRSDSSIFYDILAKDGLVEALKIAHKGLNPAYALVWYDRKNKLLNFYRNDQRPLAFINSKDNKIVFWASKPAFLFLMETESVNRYDQPYLLEPGHLLTKDLATNKWDSQKVDIPKQYSASFPNKSSVWFDRASRVANVVSRNLERRKAKKEKENTVGRLFGFIPDKKSNVIELDNMKNWRYKGYGNNYYSYEAAKDYLFRLGGCSACSNPLQISDAIYWMSVKEPVCETCYKGDWMREFFGLKGKEHDEEYENNFDKGELYVVNK